MAEIATSIVANTAGNLATEYASPYVKYFFNFGKIVEDFKHLRNQLELRQYRVKYDVDEAIKQNEEIEKDVQEWLTTAEKELGEARNLEDEIARNKCFKWCPNWGWRYCLSKKVARKTRLLSGLVNSPNFPRVGRRASFRGIESLIPNDDFTFFESSKKAFDKIMQALTSEGGNMIGLHGMPGVGKTTLAEAVAKEAREKKLFDKVVIVTVTQTPDINKIQKAIADFLNLELKTTSEKTRAEELWRGLSSVKKVLIIVDDVWDQLKLEHVGIPVGDGCKILLISRLQKVCAQMSCQEQIQLNLLSEDEAWILFKENAGLKNASPIRIDVAMEVARECKGLPLAIITMGRALKDKALNEWEVVNQRLKDSRHLENQEVCGDIYMKLKVSYDYLKENNYRSCLQLCSLFPEDYEIEIEDLTVYGIGTGMFDNVDSIEDARKEMRVITTKVQESGLLLETGGVGTVKMHDVVRDFVHWMTLKVENDQNMFYVRSGLKKWPRQSLRCCTAISLINSEINNFPEDLEFPKLEVLLLDGNSVLPFLTARARVPSMFFQGMKALKVLFLRGAILSLEDLQFLPNLRILRLERCDLENALCLGNLKKLEILIISESVIEELWYELTELTPLRLLAISCSSLKVFILPKYWLSSLVELEELCLGLNVEWATSEESSNKASLSELCSLSRLTKLSLNVDSKYIPKQLVFHALQSYNIIVDRNCLNILNWYQSGRCLEIFEFSLNAFRKLYCNVEDLRLNYIMDLEYLIDTTKDQGSKSAFTNLVRLHLGNMICLKKLCHGQPPVGFLQKLESLTIRCCSNLVLEGATVQNLKELTVEMCEQFQVIFQTDGVLPANQEIQMFPGSSLTSLSLKLLPELTSIWKGPTHHVHLCNLTNITVSSCNKLTSVFSLSLVQTLQHLERLEILDCNGLEQVFGNMAEEMDNRYDIWLPRLLILALKNLQNLSSLCPSNYFVMLPSLQKFRVLNCPKLAQSKNFLGSDKDMISCSKNLTLDRTSGCRNLIPYVDGEGLNGLVFLELQNCSNVECLYETTEHRPPTIAFSNLVELAIEEMIGLKKLCNNRPPKGFLLKLEWLRIRNCKNLASLSLVGQNIKEVMIEACDQLREIFQVDEVLHIMETNQAPVLMSNLTHLELKQLSELRCIWKRSSHSVINLRSLKILEIRNCNRLRCLFSPSLVKSLVQLEELILHDLPELEQLTTELESDVEQKQQVFNMVKEKVDEQHKPFLPLMLPSLNYFGVFKCPRLSTFVIQQEINNPAEVKGLYIHNRQCDSFDTLLRQSLPNLENGIVGNCLQFLQRLMMSNCSKLKYLFSPMLAQSLPHLGYLHIVQCKELEQIVDEDKTSASSSQGHLQPICFPSLNYIYIEECNNLKSLFSVSVALSLSQLERFTISGASELEQVFEYQSGTGIEDIEKEIVLPQLRRLSLGVLPRLKSFIPMGYHCSFPDLVLLKVKECPNLTTSFSIDSKETIHAKTKATRDARVEGSSTDVNVMEIFDTNGPETTWPIGSDINWMPREW